MLIKKQSRYTELGRIKTAQVLFPGELALNNYGRIVELRPRNATTIECQVEVLAKAGEGLDGKRLIYFLEAKLYLTSILFCIFFFEVKNKTAKIISTRV